MAAIDAHLLPFLTRFNRRYADEDWGRFGFGHEALTEALADADDETLRAAALWAHRLLCIERDDMRLWAVSELVTALARRRLLWTYEEVDWALRLTLARGEYGYDVGRRTRLPVSAAERLSPSDRVRLRALLTRLRDKVEASDEYMPPEDGRRLRRRLDTLIRDRGTEVTELPPSLLHGGDALGPALRAEMGAELNGPGIPALLVHAASASGPRPSAKWRAEAARLLAAAPDGADVVRRVLERTLRQPEQLVRQKYGGGEAFDHFVWVHESTARLLRGLLLTVIQVDEPWVTQLLGDLLLHAGGGNGGDASAPRDLVVANAAAAALAFRDEAVPLLARAQSRLKHRTVLKSVAMALAAVAERTGTPLEQLLEQTVPTYGLDEDSRRTRQVGAHRAVVQVDAPGTVTLFFLDDAGRRLSRVPAAVRNEHAEELSALRAEVKEVRKTLSAERVRIEALLAQDRSWPFEAWARHYRDHPLVGRLVRGLLWQVDDDGEWRTGLLADDRRLIALDGAALPEAGDVRLWHPLTVGADEVRAWREHLVGAEVRQPFKQAFREIYRLTPAEEETRDHSNRFAGHVLRAPQAQALMRARGWGGNSLGYWDGGFEGRVTKVFGDWRAEFWFDLLEQEADGHGTPSLAGSDQVRFSHLDGTDWAFRPLIEVPPLVFTEAMRDVDLFVGVTSIAADPTWFDRETPRTHQTYWENAAFGALGESAQNRREALQRLVPRLRIAERCSLTDRFLEVRGDLRTYKIHLGSGNILMSPDDEYLCIVPARGKLDPTVYLPFEEDGGMLSLILSKAFLLAADTKITDRSIRSQLVRH